MKQLIFFDCEFTGLHQKTKLISIGMVNEKGNTFYAEFNDFVSNDLKYEDDGGEWIKKNVIMNLEHHDVYKYMSIVNGNVELKGNTTEIKNELFKWLNLKNNEIQFVSDTCHYDFVLLINLLVGHARKLPDNISYSCYDINTELLKANNNNHLSRNSFVIDNGKRLPQGVQHNSLYDAKVIKEIYYILNK